MLLITKGTSHKLRLTTDAAGDIESSISYVDKTGTGPASYSYAASGEPFASVVSATTIDLLVGIASHEMSVRRISLYNNHGSQAVTCTIFEEDGTDTVTHQKVVLAAGESLVLDAAGVWTHYDANGGPYVGTGPFAAQGDMETATSTTKVVSPLSMNWHPGVAKAWAKHAVSGGVPQMTVTWNVTSVTDSGVCRVAPVIATDFSSANYVISYGFECNTTTYSATTTALIQCVRNGTQAAGGFTMDLVEIDIGQTTDPAAWHFLAFGDQ